MAFECSSAPDAAVICHRTLSPNFRIRLRTDDICLQVSTRVVKVSLAMDDTEILFQAC